MNIQTLRWTAEQHLMEASMGPAEEMGHTLYHLTCAEVEVLIDIRDALYAITSLLESDPNDDRER